MKMVKSLLLGSATGIVAVAGAQAADLPVKAKAVEYVKICSLYGAGYYYIPGTDICLKMGSFVRFQENWSNGGSSMSNGPWNGTGGRDTRLDSADGISRVRWQMTMDGRQQTQYGVLRSYIAMGFSNDSSANGYINSPATYATRAFIQIAGFTFGKAVSYFEFFQTAAVSYNAGSLHIFNSGDVGMPLVAYTAQFGGGVSASISAETGPRFPTVYTNTGGVAAAGTAQNAFLLGAAPTANVLSGVGVAGATGNPDIVANIRWDGTWGAFQLSGMLHDASAGYYGPTENLGHPSNKYGWAVQPGLRLNAPMIGAGDYFQIAYAYTQGDVAVVSGTNTTAYLIWNGGNLGYGNLADAVFGGTGAVNGSSVELTTAWSVASSYEHFWSPALQTSVYGSYLKVSHNANSAALQCFGNATSTTFPTATAALGCNPDWSTWNIGSRTQWNVTRSLYVGLDVMYTKLKSATPNAAGTLAPTAVNGAKPAASGAQPYSVADQSAWTIAFRVQRDIVP